MIDDTAVLADAGRLQALADYDLTSPCLRERLDEVAAGTAATLDQPVALVSFAMDSAQTIAGMHGVDGWIADVEGTPVEWSFCANAVFADQPYLVPDVTDYTGQHDNPLVTIAGFRSCTGVPLRTRRGYVLLAHCVLAQHRQSFKSVSSRSWRRPRPR